ncbi:MAG: TonB-dependent receptor [Steroidobacteraceae bacterium]
MISRSIGRILCLVTLGAAVPVSQGAELLEEIVVTATLRGSPADALPASVTVLDAETLRAAGVQHLQDVLPLIPNLNWASGTSRPRYFQIRGIGETDQWQGAPNPSVGFLIDGMDFSGIGMPATLIDLAQIEVLRGPQGTVLGANALAGLININTVAPTARPEWRVELIGAEADTRSLGVVSGGAWGAGDSAWRLAAQRYRSDGWRRNTFLGRDDTNGLDETTFRGRSRWILDERWSADVSALWVDQDNGFDAFALDNTRRTRSDDPGRDRQRSRGASVTLERAGDAVLWRSITALVEADILYAFDGDWGADADYDFTSRFLRDRRTLSQDWRWLSSSGATTAGQWAWVAGLYGLRVRENNDQLDLYGGEIFRALVSDYRSDTLAGYGSVDYRLAPRWMVSTGVRIEHRSARYRDTDGSDLAPGETMQGGNLSISFEPREALLGYLALSRGYKGGGFNLGTLIPSTRREFDPEGLDSLELGLKWAPSSGRWRIDTAVFAMRRRDQQVSTSAQLDPGDPLSFIYLTDNAARGHNRGLELAWRWSPSDSWRFGGSAAWLQARFDDYVIDDRNLAGRSQAHAPAYQWQAFVERAFVQGFYVRADLQRVADFYFSDSHDQRSRPYTLLNLKAGWARDRWRAELWLRNALNEDYAQRGFFFGNEPPDFPNRLYVQLADPRVFGVSWVWQSL